MWLHRCVFLLFLCIVNCVWMQDNVRGQLKIENDPEKEFTDVVNNITRVNKDLQELISNYEQLKKLYESNANSETEASEAEIDEVFKVKDEESTKKPGEFPATQMFWSGDEDSSNSANVNDKRQKRNKKVKSVKTVEARDIMQKAEDNSDTAQSTIERTDILSSESESENYQTIQIETVSNKSPTNIIIDTLVTSKETNEVKPKITTSVTTSKKPHNSKLKNKSKPVMKEDPLDGFSKQSIWNEMLNSKPIILQHSRINYNNRARNAMKATLRSGDTVISDVNTITNQSYVFKDVDPLVNFDQMKEEVVIKKEQFKTDVLRTAYGDACLKLVVTKCNRACVAAGKAYCHQHTCKDHFINSYKSASRKGCQKEFRGDSKPTAKPGKNLNYRGEKIPPHYEREKTIVTTTKSSDTEGGFIDLTRGGYLSGACLSSAKDSNKKHTSLRNESHVSLKTNPDVAFNILRDRYEDACKKISAGKCRKACSYAFVEACEGDCNSEKKKDATKACRKECKSAYKLRYDDSDSDYYSDLDINKSW